MKLILTAPVENLGVAGDVVEVKDGYGRNFLLPKNFAMVYNRGTAKEIEGIQRARNAKTIRDNEHALQVREQLDGLEVQVPANASDTGKLFGAVTNADIALAVRKAGGPAIDKRSVTANKPIRTVGRHGVEVKLTDAVKIHLDVEVVPAGK